MLLFVKNRPVFKSMAGILVVMFLFMPVSPVLAQTGAQGCMDGENQAKQEISGGTWFAIGCLAGLIGWIIAMSGEPNPPATALLGKDHEYVAAYTDCYRRAGKSIKTKNALTGCIVGNLAWVGVYVVLIAAASSDM